MVLYFYYPGTTVTRPIKQRAGEHKENTQIKKQRNK